MVSLSYFDEHRAWQQRIQKEINLAYLYNPKHGPYKKITYERIVDKETPQNRPLEIVSDSRRNYSRPATSTGNYLQRSTQRSGSSVINKSQIGRQTYRKNDMESESLQELQKMLRQERLRRMIAERKLKSFQNSKNN